MKWLLRTKRHQGAFGLSSFLHKIPILIYLNQAHKNCLVGGKKKCTYWISGHHFGVVDHRYKIDNSEGRIKHVGEEKVLVERDPLAAQTPVGQNILLLFIVHKS